MRAIYKVGGLFLILFIAFSSPPLTAETPSNDRTLVQGNSTFALELYQQLCSSDSNIFFSPYSISTALAMTYAGARSETEKQMGKVMHFSLSQDKLHLAFSNLQDKLNKIHEEGEVRLYIANSLWPHKEYPFKKEFLELIKENYKTPITALDYAKQTEEARKTINSWVEEKTMDKIKELIKPGILDPLTRLVLANAIYFKGNWANQFDKKNTRHMLFKVSPDKTVKTPMMYQKEKFGYWSDEDLQVLEIPYAGDRLSMVVLLPTKNDGLSQIEKKLTVENLRKWTDKLRKKKVETWLPKFKMEYSLRLEKVLHAMGMVDAFTEDADLSGMDGTDWLYISAVLHKAFVDINEEGTEAAAATAVVVGRKAVRITPQFRADHPFVFLIKEKQTGSILFMGRMIDPTITSI
ncbi:serpin family protein [Thermodesulfobacteriota bacterium]